MVWLVAWRPTHERKDGEMKDSLTRRQCLRVGMAAPLLTLAAGCGSEAKADVAEGGVDLPDASADASGANADPSEYRSTLAISGA